MFYDKRTDPHAISTARNLKVLDVLTFIGDRIHEDDIRSLTPLFGMSAESVKYLFFKECSRN